MKLFKKALPVGNEIRGFRSHHMQLDFMYDFDLSDLPTGSGEVYELIWNPAYLLQYGDWLISKDEARDGATGTVVFTAIGRFYDSLNDRFNLPVTVKNVTSGVNVETISSFFDFKIENEFFWSKNPIRIPVKDSEASPILAKDVWVEKKFNSGVFEKVATLNVVPLIGYYLDLNEVLDACMESVAYRDFGKFIVTNGHGQYEHSVLRFHIANEHFSTGTEVTINFFYVVMGGLPKEQFYKLTDKWNIQDNIMTFKQGGYWQKISAPNGVRRLPISYFQNGHYLNDEIRVDIDGETDFSMPRMARPNEKVIDTFHADDFTFLLVYRNEGSCVYVSEREVIFFRVIESVEDIAFSHMLVTKPGAGVYKIWLFYNDLSDGSLRIKTVTANIRMGLSAVVRTSHIFPIPVEGKTWQWRAVCLDYAKTGIAAAVGEIGSAGNYFVKFNGTSDFDLTSLSTIGNGIVTSMCNTNDANSYYAGIDGVNLYETIDNGATWTTAGSIARWASSDVQFYKISNTFRLFIYSNDTPADNGISVGGGTIGAVVSGKIGKSVVWYSGSMWYILVQAGGSDLKLYSYNGVSTITLLNTFPFYIPDNDVFPIFSNTFRVSHIVNRVLDDMDYFEVLNTNNTENLVSRMMAATMVYYNYVPGSAGDPQTIEILNDSGVGQRYKFDGKHLRQFRTLWFRNSAGAYEFLLLRGEAEEDVSGKKKKSIRYTDAGSEFEAGEEFVAWVNDLKQTVSVNSGYVSKDQYGYLLYELTWAREFYLQDKSQEYWPVSAELVKPLGVNDKQGLYSFEFLITKSFLIH